MFYTEEDLPQGSGEWLEWRRGGIGGSTITHIANGIGHLDVPAELKRQIQTHEPPEWVDTPLQVYRKHFGLEPSNISTFQAERGHRLEPLARELAECELGYSLAPCCLYVEEEPYLRVSLDGYNRKYGYLIEVKAPMNPWDHLPEYVRFQTAYQAATLRKENLPVEAITVLEIGQDADGELTVRPWPIDVEDALSLGNPLTLLAKFFWTQHIEPGVPPPYAPNELMHVNDDAELASLSAKYRALKEQEATVTAALEELRAQILERANILSGNQPGIIGCGIRVRMREGGWRTDYKAIVDEYMPNADFSRFRRAQNTSGTITLLS